MIIAFLANGPYSGMMKSTLTFCEANVDGLIAQPINTWTNLAYIFVSIYLFFQARKTNSFFLKSFALIPALIGIFSFSFHATNTFLGGSLDLISMFLFSSILLINNFYRLKLIAKNHLILAYVLWNLTMFITHFFLVFQFGIDWGSQLFAINAAIIIITEAVIVRHHKKLDIFPLEVSLSYMAIAMGIWLLDIFKIWCDAKTFHYFNGHGFWHILTAVSLLVLYYYYRQFYHPKHIREQEKVALKASK